MDILKLQKVSNLKKAFELNLQICGVDRGEIMWMGNWKNFQTFQTYLEEYDD